MHYPYPGDRPLLRPAHAGIAAALAAAMVAALPLVPVDARTTTGPAADGAAAPTGHISNGQLDLSFYIPDPAKGFYRGTRFDWSGIVYSLRYRGEEYCGRWYDRIDPSVSDNIRQTRPDGRGEVVTGIASSGQGPAEEFLTSGKALGFDAAPPGGTFLKIGVGILRRPDDKPYDRYRAYDIVNGGKWTTKKAGSSVIFVQTLDDRETGYGYVYAKTLRLVPGKPMLRIEHRLRNTGRMPLVTSVYDHNFFATKGHRTGPDYAITTPWPITSRPPAPDLARIEGNRLLVTKSLETQDMLAMPIQGFGPAAVDYAFHVENLRTGTGYSVKGDRPLERIWLWGIWTNISMEAFIKLDAQPGREERWAYEYRYFTRGG